MLAFENCKFYFVIVGFILIKRAEHNETLCLNSFLVEIYTKQA